MLLGSLRDPTGMSNALQVHVNEQQHGISTARHRQCKLAVIEKVEAPKNGKGSTVVWAGG